MKKPTPIQIDVPNPCSEDWNRMTPCENGRFCKVCQKTVIDFTNWSDEALFKFFTDKNERVCGRFTAYQLNRKITIRHQPYSQLYRLAIAFGLTLVFTQIPNANARYRPPLAWIENNIQDDTPQYNAGAITGIVVDSNTREPVIGAIIMLLQGGIPKGGTQTDVDGKFEINPIDPGKYDVTVNNTGYKVCKLTSIIVYPGKQTNIKLNIAKADNISALIKLGGGTPLVDTFGIQEQRNYRSDQIEKMGTHDVRKVTDIANGIYNAPVQQKKKHWYQFWKK